MTTELTEEEYEKFCELIYRVSGIRIAENKRVMVGNRVRRRLRATGIGSFAEYYTFLTSPAGTGEMPLFLDEITTNETYFFRDIQHYDWLGETFLPEIAQNAALRKRPKTLRIWSAACSTGEEPYSIALKFLGKKAAVRRLADHDPGDRPERRGPGRRPRRPLRRPGRPPRRARPAARVLRRGPGGRALDRQARGQGAGHLEAAQPAHPHQGGTVRLHLHQECADLFRHGFQADRRPQPDRCPGQGRIPGRRPHRGDLYHARPPE